jgi:hypothetical protein
VSPAAAAAAPSARAPLASSISSSSSSGAPAQQQQGRRRRGAAAPAAGLMDTMPAWTLDQIAGLMFGVRFFHAGIGRRWADVWSGRSRPANAPKPRPRRPPPHPTPHASRRPPPPTPHLPNLAPAQALMLGFLFGAPQVDVWVARAQRRQLGLCERCGGVNDAGTCGDAACPMRRAGGGGGSGGS